ncbi:MAG: Fur family transcriptional regulator [Gordonia sp. (in: high G+C Gram-positive bacteria)]|uniref:Fur family transcriptional regulator n=1 Tax=Gordonia TaxID=2053 RepID=UPI003266C503
MTARHHEHHAADRASVVAQAIAELSRRGERVTRARREMLEVLSRQHEHLTADEVAELVREDGVHRATVYRALEAFAAAGIVSHRQDPGGATAYHLVTPSHLHVHCGRCGTVGALAVDTFDGASAAILAATGFVFDPNRSTLVGVCGACTSGREQPGAPR